MESRGVLVRTMYAVWLCVWLYVPVCGCVSSSACLSMNVCLESRGCSTCQWDRFQMTTTTLQPLYVWELALCTSQGRQPMVSTWGPCTLRTCQGSGLHKRSWLVLTGTLVVVVAVLVLVLALVLVLVLVRVPVVILVVVVMVVVIRVLVLAPMAGPTTRSWLHSRQRNGFRHLNSEHFTSWWPLQPLNVWMAQHWELTIHTNPNRLCRSRTSCAVFRASSGTSRPQISCCGFSPACCV